MPANKIFFDTNILVYQFDHTALSKRKLAIKLIEQSIEEATGAISSQVVQEFINVALKKFDIGIQIEELKLVMTDLLTPLCKHYPTFSFYERSLKLYEMNSINMYDAFIIQAAIDLGCKTLYSEDLQDGRSFNTLTVKNPFKQGRA